VRRIQENFERSPRKSTRRTSEDLEIPQPTVWRVLRRRLLFNCVDLFESLCILNNVQVTFLCFPKENLRLNCHKPREGKRKIKNKS